MYIFEKIVDVVLGKAITWLNNKVVFPIKVSLKKNERREFTFKTTLLPNTKLDYSEVINLLSDKYESLTEETPNKLVTNIFLNKTRGKLTIELNRDYSNIEPKNKIEFGKAPIDSITFSYICYALLKEVQDNCNRIKGELEKIKSEFEKDSLKTEFTHNQLRFNLKKEVGFAPLKGFKKANYFEISIGQGIIKLDKESCVISVKSWLIDSETQHTLFELLAFLGA